MKSIIYIDHSEVLPGEIEDLKHALEELGAFIRDREPQLLSYGFYLDEETRRLAVVAVHPDARSLEYHMEVGGPAFRSFAQFLRLQAIEVYGDLSPRALEQLREKATYLGGATLEVHSLTAGFERIPTRS
jgi:hypothetical protein